MDKKAIKQSIHKAIAAHGLWKTRLRQAIDTQTSEFDVDFVRSSHNCEFGKWLDGDRSNLRTFPQYQDVYKQHQVVHEMTAQVMSLALKGDKSGADELLKSKFLPLSQKLTITMMGWDKALAA